MDFTTDNNPADFKYIVSLLEDQLPGMQKFASEIYNQDASLFADSIRKEFPIHDEQNTVLSKIYFETYKNDNNRIRKSASDLIALRLKKANELFELAPIFSVIEETVNGLSVKQASAEEDKYALVMSAGDTTYGFYPIQDAEDVVDSSVKLAKDKYKMTEDWFKSACVKLVDSAEKFNVPSYRIPRLVKEAGVRNELSTDLVPIALEQRTRIVNDDETKAIYEELFKAAAAMVDANNDIVEHLKLIEDMDMSNNIKYATVLSPAKTFYSGMSTKELEKLANTTMVILNTPVPAKAFAGIPFQKIACQFDKETAAQIKGLQAKANTGSAGDLYTVSKEMEQMGSDVQRAMAELLCDIA